MASSKFFRRQADKCADLARQGHDADGRQRWAELQRTYCYLAEMEEQQTGELSKPSDNSENKLTV